MKEASAVLANYNETMLYEAASIKDSQLTANALGAIRVNDYYVDNINLAIDKANNTILESVTTKVGTKKPNQLGLYDCSGNIWEWCYDTATNG